MAKKIPVRKKAKAKAEQSEYATKLDERYEYANEIYLLQDEATQEMIRHMERVALKMMGSPNEKMARYVAVRLCVATAKWDIRLANFKLSKKRCADCGVKA